MIVDIYKANEIFAPKGSERIIKIVIDEKKRYVDRRRQKSA